MRVVIAGGGFCGAMVAKKLDHVDEIESVLIDEKEYFEYYPSLPKLIIDPGHHDKIIKPYSRFLKNTKIISKELKKITPETVSTETDTFGFDILVITLGADYPIFLENDQNIFTISSGEEVKKLSGKVETADRLLIVGGGLIGTEVAGELASKTEKNITLVHSHERLIERNPKMASYFAEMYLESKGVELIFDEKVVSRDENIFRTDSGKEIDADVCIWCTGLNYDKSLFEDLKESTFADNGALKVNEHLQVKNYPNIFAGGDITDIDEEKTGHTADSHSRIIVENVLRKKEDRSMKTYGSFKSPLVISLGDLNGLLSAPPIAVPGPIPALVKHSLEKGALLRL